MSWTDSHADPPTRPNRHSRPNRSTYLPPHLRNTSNPYRNPPFFTDNPRPVDDFGFTSESSHYRSSPSRGGGRSGARGRGRGRGGRGRTWPSPNQTEYVDPNPNPVDVFEKFDDLEIIEDIDFENGGINLDAYEDIPVEASGSDIPPPANSFPEIDLGKELNDNIKRCKYVKPTPIQRYGIPVAMAGRDLMACAQTGSGKTAAFCFPIISGILRQHLSSVPGRQTAGVACPLALILSPTRELSCQIHEEAKKFSYQTGVKVAVAYGGASIIHQLHNLEKGVDILVATPGRLVDMIEKGKVSLKRIKYLALDEADHMLDMGFERQIRIIVEQMDMPPPGARQTMLFSATFPTEIQRLASDFLSNYIFLAVGRVGSSTDLIVQKVEFVQDMDKRDRLIDLLIEQVANEIHGKLALTLIFVETKRAADAMEHWLCRNGFPATAIHGDKMQMERERALRSFKTGATPILVATDIAARGLDVPHVTHVINFDLPKDIDDYVHRIGRTGRAGKSGLATAFFSDKNLPLAKSLVELMQEANQQVPSWLTQYAKTSSAYGSNRAYRHGGSKYGFRDFRSAPSMDGYSNYSSSSYADPVAFADPHMTASGAFTSNGPAGTGYPVAGVNSYAGGGHGYGFDHGSIVAGGWGTFNSYVA